MSKDLSKVSGTIAFVLSEHKDEMFELINGGRIQESKELCIKLLDDPRIKDKSAASKAKSVIIKTKTYNYYSTLVTYMTGLKV